MSKKKFAKRHAKVAALILDVIQKYRTKKDIPYRATMDGGSTAADGSFQLKIYVSYPPEEL